MDFLSFSSMIKLLRELNIKVEVDLVIKDSLNGVNRLATNGKKYIWLPTKRKKKNYQLPTGKLLTDN